MRFKQGSDPRVFFVTLGCPKNDADSRALKRCVLAAGLPVTEDVSTATHIVVNTCGFIADAKEESIETLLELCEDHPDKEVLAVGCLVERYREELAEGLPEVSAWLGVTGQDTGRILVRHINGQSLGAEKPSRGSVTDATAYAYVKISDGCDEGCTFCAIPGIKGAYSSVSTAEILREADACLSEGARELVLVGQDTTRWRDGDVDLPALIDMLSEDARVKRVRVMYLQPNRVDGAFLSFMAGHAKLCRYLDIPFQHSHAEILRQMGRRGEAGAYSELLGRARQLMPTVATRSTFIVGFPGETERHFAHLLGFVRDARFDYGGAFVYSPEEGTAAELLRPRVARRVALERLNILNDSLLEVGEQMREQAVGSEVEVMIDSVGPDEAFENVVAVGRTEGQAPEVDGVTYVTGRLAPGTVSGAMARVKVTEVLGCDLLGEVVAA